MRKKVFFLSTIFAFMLSLIAYLLFAKVINVEKIYHTVTFDTQGGTAVEPLKVQHGKKIKEPSTALLGYHIASWLNNDDIWDFKTNCVEKDILLKATWDLTIYNITYIFNGGSSDVPYQTTYTIKDTFELIRPDRPNYVFGGWFDENNKRIDSIELGTIGDIVLKAKWTGNLKTVACDSTRGSISVYASETLENEYTVVNVPVGNKYHTFKGWYDSNDNLLSTEQTYTFILPDDNEYYIYSKYMNDSEEAIWNYVHGVTPSFLDNGHTLIKYGMYPQTNVQDSDLISKLVLSTKTKFNNYYYYSGEYYAKITAVLARNYYGELLKNRCFDNGEEIIEGEEYWFKVEPINWRIFNQDASNNMITSTMALDVQRFNNTDEDIDDGESIIHPNDYYHSHLRKWLNNEFFDTAFCFNVDPIESTFVDCSASTTMNPEQLPNYTSSNDNVYIFSYKDYRNPEYGFEDTANESDTRRILTTDYARASGCLYEDEEENTFSSYLWTRSCYEYEYDSKNYQYVSKINRRGYLNGGKADYLMYSFQPCLTINEVVE